MKKLINLRNLLALVCASSIVWVFADGLGVSVEYQQNSQTEASDTAPTTPWCEELGPDVYTFIVHSKGDVLVAREAEASLKKLSFYEFKNELPSDDEARSLNVNSTAKKIAEFPGEVADFVACDWSSTDYAFALATKEGSLCVYKVFNDDVLSTKCVREFAKKKIYKPVRVVSWCKSATFLAVATDDEITFYTLLWTPTDALLKEVFSMPLSQPALYIKWSHDDRYFVAGDKTSFNVYRFIGDTQCPQCAVSTLDCYKSSTGLIKDIEWSKSSNVISVLTNALQLVYVSDVGINTDKTQQTFVKYNASVLAWDVASSGEQLLAVSDQQGDYQTYMLDDKGCLVLEVVMRNFLEASPLEPKKAAPRISKAAVIELVNSLIHKNISAAFI